MKNRILFFCSGLLLFFSLLFVVFAQSNTQFLVNDALQNTNVCPLDSFDSFVVDNVEPVSSTSLFRTYQRIAEEWTGVNLSPTKQERSIDLLIQKGIIISNFTVLYPELVINDALVRLGETRRKAEINVKRKTRPQYAVLIGLTENGNVHARLANSRGKEIWNPQNPAPKIIRELSSIKVHLVKK